MKEEDCWACQGTGIGYGCPDLPCSVCRGRGWLVVRDDDDPDVEDAEDRRWHLPR
jgi:DnaJ-class molecular chaperone